MAAAVETATRFGNGKSQPINGARVLAELKELMTKLSQTDLDANQLHAGLSDAGIIVHPVMLQNILARRYRERDA